LVEAVAEVTTEQAVRLELQTKVMLAAQQERVEMVAQAVAVLVQ